MKLVEQDLVYWPKNGNGKPRIKQFSDKAKGLVPMTLWFSHEVGDTEGSKKELLEIFSDRESIDFHAPKPPELIERVIEIATGPDGLILDSFAGTGSSAHAVLKANRKLGGNRKFILVECEAYADTLTAERVRRVVNGYSFTGTQRTELLRENLTWRSLQGADALVQNVHGLENLHGHEFDRITKQVRDGELIVSGERNVAEKADGLGGVFTFCTLGPAIELDKILTGETLPNFASLGAALFHMATNSACDPSAMKPDEFYLGAADGRRLWLIYKPDLEWLKSPDAALTLSRAQSFAATDAAAKHLVFAPARFVSQKVLADHKELAPVVWTTPCGN